MLGGAAVIGISEHEHDGISSCRLRAVGEASPVVEIGEVLVEVHLSWQDLAKVRDVGRRHRNGELEPSALGQRAGLMIAGLPADGPSYPDRCVAGLAQDGVGERSREADDSCGRKSCWAVGRTIRLFSKNLATTVPSPLIT